MSTEIMKMSDGHSSKRHKANMDKAIDHSHTVLAKKDAMGTELGRVLLVIHRFKEVIIALSSMVSADVRVFRMEELQLISEHMCTALNELTHMVEYTDEVFSADDFMIIAREMKKQRTVRGKVLVILLRSHRVLLETISHSLTSVSTFSDPSCVVIEGAVTQMEAILPRSAVKVHTMWGDMFGEA